MSRRTPRPPTSSDASYSLEIDRKDLTAQGKLTVLYNADGEGLFGEGSWIFDVQAHPPTTAPGSNTREDGQLLLLTNDDDDDDDDDGDDD